MAIMSDSSIALKPVTDDPSKPIPWSSADASSSRVIAKLFSRPTRSVNHSRTNLISASPTSRSTRCRASATPAVVVSIVSIVLPSLGFRAQKNAPRWLPTESPGGVIASRGRRRCRPHEHDSRSRGWGVRRLRSVRGDHGDQHVHHLRVEVPARAAAQLGIASCDAPRLAVDAIGGHRVVRVAGQDHARAQRDLGAGQAVAGSRCRPSARGRRSPAPPRRPAPRTGSRICAPSCGMRLHHAALRRRQRARLVQDLGRDPDLADVVQGRGDADVAQLGAGHPQPVGDLGAQADQGLGVVVGVGILRRPARCRAPARWPGTRRRARRRGRGW